MQLRCPRSLPEHSRRIPWLGKGRCATRCGQVRPTSRPTKSSLTFAQAWLSALRVTGVNCSTIHAISGVRSSADTLNARHTSRKFIKSVGPMVLLRIEVHFANPRKSSNAKIVEDATVRKCLGRNTPSRTPRSSAVISTGGKKPGKADDAPTTFATVAICPGTVSVTSSSTRRR